MASWIPGKFRSRIFPPGTSRRTEADSRKELDKNMREALNLYLNEPEDSSVLFPLPNRSLGGANIVAVAVEPKVALAYLLRFLRHRHGWIQTQASKAIGMNGLYSYQRLERAETANPLFDTLIRIKKAYPEFCLDDILS